MVGAMTELAINLTSIGASHIRVGKECQDFSLSESTDTYSMAIVCDGHGGDNYFRSAYGSCFAAQAASACISEFMQDLDTTVIPEKPDQLLVQLEKSIIAKWNTSVWNHFESNPFTEEELNSVSESRRQRILAGKSIESTYGTTLIALAWTEAFWFGIQIGDGKCVRIKKDGSFDQPIPVNDKCFLNSTTSICDANAIEDFRHCFSTEMPAAVFCGSDGIDDSFIRDEQLYKLYSTIARSLSENEYDSAFAELEDYLPRLSSKGSGDDVSIAGILNREAVLDALPEIPVPEPEPEPEESADRNQTQESEQEINSDSEDIPSNLQDENDSIEEKSVMEGSKGVDSTIADQHDNTAYSGSVEETDEAPSETNADTDENHISDNASTETNQSNDELGCDFEGNNICDVTRPKFCVNCGAKLNDVCKFCPECGTEVELVRGRIAGECL